MSTELALIQPRTLTPDTWKMIREIAPVTHAARMFGVASPEQAAAIMLKGYELGFGLASSFQFIKVILGKPELVPMGALAILHASPEIATIEVRRLTDQQGTYVGHECYIKRRNGFEYTARFTLADAQRAGLVKPDSGWEKYPENMCLWRSVGFAADVAAADLIAGNSLLLKAPESVGVTLTEAGDVIEGIASHVQSPTRAQPWLDELVSKYGPEKVIAANGGSIPSTDEEIDKVALALDGKIAF